MKEYIRHPHSDLPVTFVNVDVWNPDVVLVQVDVTIRNGRIVSIHPTSSKHECSTVNGFEPQSSSGHKSQRLNRHGRLVLMPSAVDLQVHLRTPGQWHKETPETGLRAALVGGVGAVLTMPNTKPVIDSVDALKLCRQQVQAASAKLGIDVLISVAGTVGQNGKQVAPLAELVRNGAHAVTDDGKGIESDVIQLEIFRALEALDVPFLQHAETLGAEGPLAPGPVQEQLGLRPYDERHEVDMVRRDLLLLNQTPRARYHLLHTSSAKSLALIREAKSRGLRVTAEASPHHLFFASHDIEAENKSFKMNPPIRSEVDRAALISALADGTLDFVATDHAPHEKETKNVSFETAAFGTLGLETMLPVLLTLVERGLLSRTRMVQVASSNPAQFIGLDRSFGALHVGELARFAVVDPKQKWIVRAERLQSLSKNSCFDGVELTGCVVGHVNPSGQFLQMQ